MLPVILDVENLTIAIIGSGPQARRRLEMVDAAGASFVRVFAEQPEAEMVALAGDRLVENWPDESDIAACHIIYVANVEDALAELEQELLSEAMKDDNDAISDPHLLQPHLIL